MNAKLRKSLVIIAAVIMFLLLAVSTAVPAFAAESDMTVQSNEKFEVVEPKYEGDTNSNVTLPDAPVKDGYTFKGWSVDGSTELHNAGESIVNNDGHKLQLQPVYEVTTSEKVDDSSVSSTTEGPDLLNEYEDGTDIVLQYGHDNILTLPDAKEKEGYDFYGWSVNGSTDLYDSGVTIPIKAGEKVTLRPVYVSTKERDDFYIKCIVVAAIGLVILIVLRVTIDITDSNALCVLGLLVSLAITALLIVGLIEGHRIEQRALAEALQQLKYITP